MNKRFGLLAAVVLAATALVGCAAQPTEEDYKKWANDNGYVLADPALPAARLEGKTTYNPGDSGVQITPAEGSGAAKLVDYLDREDVVYIDLRGFQDYVQGHIEGFECIPHFDVIMASGGAKGSQLFYEENGEIKPTYDESVSILNAMFPKNRTIFLMCLSGGRVVNTMNVLEANGYDMSKVYNVGGWKTVDSSYPTTKGGALAVTTTFDFSDLTPVK